MAGILSFFTNDHVSERDLPLPEYRVSPKQADSEEAACGCPLGWTNVKSFFVDTEVRDDELPAPEHRLVVGEKRGRDAAATTPARRSAAATADAGSDDLVSKLAAMTPSAIDKDTTITKSMLVEYILATGAQAPPRSKKLDLAKVAHRAASESATPARASAGSATEEDAGDDSGELPTSGWTVARMKAYAAANNISLDGVSIKADIYDRIAPAKRPSPAKRASSGSRKRSTSAKRK